MNVQRNLRAQDMPNGTYRGIEPLAVPQYDKKTKTIVTEPKFSEPETETEPEVYVSAKPRGRKSKVEKAPEAE